MNKQGAPEPIAALNRVRILENAVPFAEREPLADIREFCPDVVIRENVCPYLRRRVAEMVNQAQASLPSGYKLKVKSALRTLSAQRFGWDNYHKKLREEHPEWPLSTLRRMTNKYFAPYDQPAPPGHCTGAAVDVGLIAPDGEELDLIAPHSGWEAAATWTDDISPEAKQNRMLMVEAMLGAGFSNCRDEYWHYSYGDSAWAVRIGVRECPYGWTHLPVALETDFENASAVVERVDSVREPQNGRVVAAKAWCGLPSGAEQFHVGVYWANDVPITLHVDLPAETTLYLGNDENVYTPLDVFAGQNGVVVEFVPAADRVWIANYLPPPKPADDASESEPEQDQSEAGITQ